MKIVHIHFGRDGGAEKFFVNLINAFAEMGIEQIIFIRPNRPWRSKIHPSIEIHEGLPRLLSIFKIILKYKLLRILKKNNPNGIIAWMPRAAEFTPKWIGCPRIARLGDYPKTLKHFKNIETLVCNTPGIADHVRRLGWSREVRVISNFTTLSGGGPIDRSELGVPPNAFLVLGVGRFVRRKGFHTLIASLTDLPDVYLCLLGEGEERANLEEQARRAGVIDRVRFMGWKLNPGPYYAACDAFCMPSLHEPLGNVILEAWANKKPVISSRSEGPLWMIKNEENGLLFDIEDSSGLAKGIKRLSNDDSLRLSLVSSGEKTLLSRFSKQGITRAYLDLIANHKL